MPQVSLSGHPLRLAALLLLPPLAMGVAAFLFLPGWYRSNLVFQIDRAPSPKDRVEPLMTGSMLYTAIGKYKVDHGVFPPDLAALGLDPAHLQTPEGWDPWGYYLSRWQGAPTFVLTTSSAERDLALHLDHNGRWKAEEFYSLNPSDSTTEPVQQRDPPVR